MDAGATRMTLLAQHDRLRADLNRCGALARRLREQVPTLPIIVMHGQTLIESEWAETLRACSISVAKPVSAGVLLDAAQRLMTRSPIAA